MRARVRYALAFPLAFVVATWEAVGDGLREAHRTWRQSFRAIVEENHPDAPPDPSEGRGMGDSR